MATVTFTIGASSKSFTVSAGDVTRVINAQKARYGPALSNAEIFDLWAVRTMKDLKDAVKYEEGEAAAAAARAAIVDVVAT